MGKCTNQLKQTDNVHFVDTLKGLQALSDYDIRVVYKGVKYRMSDPIRLSTEDEQSLSNGDFEGDWSSKTISGLINGANILYPE